MTERVRFTISVEPEVYEAFADLAHTSGVSLSRCIGDWLRDTAEAAQITTIKVNEVRRSPQDAFESFMGAMALELPRMRERLHATAWGVAAGDGAGKGVAGSAAQRATRSDLARAGRPPSSNTGGKSPGKTRSTP